MKDWFRRFFAGMGIGIGAAIPGVSGAAVAVIFKVYKTLIDAINSFRKHFGHSVLTLLPIVLGIVCAVIPCIKLFSMAFAQFMFGLICIFAGFLIGSFPGVTDEVRGVKPNAKQKIAIVIGIIFVIGMGILSIIVNSTTSIGHYFLSMPWWLYLVLVPVGVLAAVALTVPGLSGSLILLILGFYRPLVDSASSWGGELLKGDFSHTGWLIGMILCFGVGCLIGVVLVSKIMSWLLKKWHDTTFFAIIGFVLGSIVVVFCNYDIFNYYRYWAGANLPDSIAISPILGKYMLWEIPIGIVLLVVCAALSYLLVVKSRKNKEAQPA